MSLAVTQSDTSSDTSNDTSSDTRVSHHLINMHKMTDNLFIVMRIRVLKHDLEVNLLLAVRAGVLLANNAPSADAKLVKARRHTVKAQHNTS